MANLRGTGVPRGRGRGRGRQARVVAIPEPEPEQQEPQQPEQNEMQEMRRMLQEQRALIDVLLTERQGRQIEGRQAEEEQNAEEEDEQDDQRTDEAEESDRSQSPPRRNRAMAVLPQPNQVAETTQYWVTQFCKLKPPAFCGKLDLAEDWLMRLDKIFEVMECPENRKAQLAIYKLEGDADRWWRSIATTLQAHYCPITWEKFLEKFNEQYFPLSVQVTKESEFLHIQQGHEESFDDYLARFTNLSRYSSHLRWKDDESSMANILIYGLKHEIRERLVSQRFRELIQAVESCRLIERNLKELRASRNYNSSSASRGGLSRGNFSQKREAPWNNSQGGSKTPFQSRQQNYPIMPGPRPCPKCGTNHPGTNCARERICYKCQKPGHFYTNCPQRTAEMRP